MLFSVTAADCDWSYTRGTGKGGQKRNKTSSAVHCTHKLSGAHGYSEASRSQHDNKKTAFRKMAESKEFKKWNRIEAYRKLGIQAEIEQYVEYELEHHVRVEGKVDGKWTELSTLG